MEYATYSAKPVRGLIKMNAKHAMKTQIYKAPSVFEIMDITAKSTTALAHLETTPEPHAQDQLTMSAHHVTTTVL